MTFPNLNGLDPAQSFRIADAQIAAENVGVLSRFDVRIYTNTYAPLMDITRYISTTATFKRNNVGTATIVLPGDDPAIPYCIECERTVVPVTVTFNGMRWSGRIDTCADDVVDGVNTVTLQCLDDWNWLNHILVWCNPYLPIELQWPQENIMIGPAKTVLETMIAAEAIRLQSGLWEFVNNILDPGAWFASAVESLGLLTPICVVPSDPLTDTSNWVAIEARFDACATLVQAVCKDAGLCLTASIWFPGEPQPTTAFTLTLPTIVIKIEDKSGVTGPTGTIIDGLIKDVVDIADGMFGEIANPLNSSGYLPPGVVIDPAFGVNWTPPWPVYMVDDPRSGIKECHIVHHSPQSHTVVGGGKSPRWVNQLIDTAIETLISLALAALGVSGIAPTLLDGLFDNVVLAFQEIEDAPRRFALGPYAYPETFVGTGSTAWTVEEFFALANGLWDTRGYASAQIITWDNVPYTFGKDFGIGDLVSWVKRGKMYTDYTDEVTVTDDRQNRVQVLAKIGDLTAQEAPWVKMGRYIKTLEDALQIALLSSN